MPPDAGTVDGGGVVRTASWAVAVATHPVKPTTTPNTNHGDLLMDASHLIGSG
jgi:hypothetical protein